MRLSVRVVEITSGKRARFELERLGLDPAGSGDFATRSIHYNLKLLGPGPGVAGLLKKEADLRGGRPSVAVGAGTSGVIISGTLHDLGLFIDGLRSRRDVPPELVPALKAAIDNSRQTRRLLKGRTRTWQTGARTLIMGILNVTPDSFHDGGRFLKTGAAVERALRMADEGADIIDVGGESSRPGAGPVGLDEELRRVLPVVEALSKRGLCVSVDTTKSEVARRACEAGAEMINDISAFTMDPEMAGVCAGFGAACVLMHMRGTPRTMQKDVNYEDLLEEVFMYLAGRLEYAASTGIDPERTVIDPGLGFGKSREGNLELISRLSEFKALGRPVLVGPSRKSFTAGPGRLPTDRRLPATLAAVAASVMNGADIVRVHDVAETKRAVEMAGAIRDAADLRPAEKEGERAC